MPVYLGVRLGGDGDDCPTAMNITLGTPWRIPKKEDHNEFSPELRRAKTPGHQLLAMPRRIVRATCFWCGQIYVIN